MGSDSISPTNSIEVYIARSFSGNPLRSPVFKFFYVFYHQMLDSNGASTGARDQTTPSKINNCRKVVWGSVVRNLTQLYPGSQLPEKLVSNIRRHYDSLPLSYAQAGFDMKEVSLHIKLKGCDKGNSYEFELRKDLMELMTCGHKNILQFYGVCIDENHGLCVVTKFMEGGSVHDLMLKNKKLQMKEIIRISADVAEGIKFMNDHGIAYRDLNTQRILLEGMVMLA